MYYIHQSAEAVLGCASGKCGCQVQGIEIFHSFYSAGQHRAGPYGGSTGPTPLFEDTSTESTQGMPGISTGFSQYAGNEFLQGPMANVAVGYGAQMANQGKEYVEKHVCIKALYKM